MADELQTVKLATSIAQTGSPLPRVHGAYYAVFSQLYPILLAPLVASLSMPTAIEAAHGLNALLLASAAWPAYLLGRRVAGSHAAGLVAAALTAFTPWLVLSSTVLTESAAYPAFVWAVLLVHRALVEPSRTNDALALGGLALAFLARTQLFVLALALPVALVLHERGRLRTIPRRHAVLVAAYAAGGAAVVGLAAAGETGSLVGNYSTTFGGDLLPAGIWRSAAVHLVYVAVAGGVAPLLLAAAWAAVAVVRASGDERAFSSLLLVLVPLLTFEVASFDLRFTPGGFVQDRYLVYLTPLLAVGGVAALARPGVRAVRALVVVAAGAGFAGLASLASFAATPIWWASPGAAFHPTLARAANGLGLSTGSLVRWSAVALAVVLAVAIARAPALPALLAVGAALVAFGAYEAVDVFEREALPATTRPWTLGTPSRNWVDATAPPGEVALLPNPAIDEQVWWDAEFWNKRVAYAVRLGGSPTFTPFPAGELRLDWQTGAIAGDEPTDLVVRAADEARVHLAEAATLLEAPPLVLVRVQLPYRADWATRGAEPDGWMLPGKPVRLRGYPPTARAATVTLSALPGGARLLVRSGSRSVRASVAEGAARRVTIPLSGGDATLVARGSSRLPDGRRASLHLDQVEISP